MTRKMSRRIKRAKRATKELLLDIDSGSLRDIRHITLQGMSFVSKHAKKIRKKRKQENPWFKGPH